VQAGRLTAAVRVRAGPIFTALQQALPGPVFAVAPWEFACRLIDCLLGCRWWQRLIAVVAPVDYASCLQP